MRASKALAVCLALVLPALVFAPYVAAQGEKSGDKKGESKGAPSALKKDDPAKTPAKKYDPNNTTALSEAMETCVEGNAKYVARDMAGAIESYKKAVSLAPKNALAHYLLGEAELGSGNAAGAESEWKLALESVDEKDPSLKAHILFVIADLKERTKKWDEAKTAWQAYGEFAAKHADAGAYPSSGTSRQQVIDDMLRQDRLYEVVRQRIAAEKDGGAEPASPAPSTTKPSATPKK